MTIERKLEFLLMLLLERKSYEEELFNDFLHKKYDLKAFNDRYMELLDEYLNKYAIDTIEKSN